MEKRDLTRLLGWPGYRVYKYEVDEGAKTLKLWVRRKPIHRGFECSGCGRRVHAVVAAWEREVADLDCFEFRVTVVVEVHRLNCVGGQKQRDQPEEASQRGDEPLLPEVAIQVVLHRPGLGNANGAFNLANTPADGLN